jgi:L-lactate dehydrogenase complex protein LldE
MAETVQLFITCLIDTLYPHIAEAVVDVLQRAGVSPEIPTGQTCCGQPAFNAGLRQQARPVAQ